ncbi:MAG TPA: 2OG-Fe(II) oxygenase [Flavobacteriales bacterium]|nr:2OG-Fe(II) oxygenase [Flavobacteriales bacterium]
METMWQPQTSAQDAPIAALKNFCYLIKLPISRSTIEKEVKEHKNYPAISFEDIAQILQKWGLSVVFTTVPQDVLSEIPKPSISFQYDQNGKNNSGNYIIITEMNQHEVKYLHVRRGWFTEDISIFNNYWSKIAMIITEIDKEKFGEIDFKTKEREYIARKNANPDLKIVRTVDDFLTDEECDYIIDLSNQKFERSKLTGDTLIEGFGRTSYTANLVFPTDKVLNNIRNRAAELLKIPESHFEYFQCVSYEKGQEYMNHFDTFDEKTEMGRKALENGGQRKYTMLAYLNDDFSGGETHFPNLDHLVKPKKRRVVIFNNLDENGNVLTASWHAGLPVSSGRKYAINMWVREKPIVDR